MHESRSGSLLRVWKDPCPPPPPHYTHLWALLVIMRVKNHGKMMVSDGGSRRLDDTTNATGEERDAAQSNSGCDDGPNPTVGSHVLDGPREEMNSTPFF